MRRRVSLFQRCKNFEREVKTCEDMKENGAEHTFLTIATLVTYCVWLKSAVVMPLCMWIHKEFIYILLFIWSSKLEGSLIYKAKKFRLILFWYFSSPPFCFFVVLFLSDQTFGDGIRTYVYFHAIFQLT